MSITISFTLSMAISIAASAVLILLPSSTEGMSNFFFLDYEEFGLKIAHSLALAWYVEARNVHISRPNNNNLKQLDKLDKEQKTFL